MNKVDYRYDIFNESSIHCRECKYISDPYAFEPYCTKSGRIVHDYGYCSHIKREKIKEVQK